jgi:hypothetical protein
MKLYAQTFFLLLIFVTSFATNVQAQAWLIVGGSPLNNFTFMKIPMPKSNFTLADCNEFGAGTYIPISPKGNYDTVQITWDVDEGDWGDVQSAGIEEASGPGDFSAVVCWISVPFTLYVGTGLLNQTNRALAHDNHR